MKTTENNKTTKVDETLSEYWDKMSDLFSKLEGLPINNEKIKNINREYIEIISNIKKHNPISIRREEPEAFIFTLQILNQYHSPTKLTFFWADFLSDIFKKVTIVVCPPFESAKFTFNNKYDTNGFFPFHSQNNNIKILNFKERLTEESLNTLINKLSIRTNDLLLSIGHSIPFFDLIESDNKLNRPSFSLSLAPSAKFITTSSNDEVHYNLNGIKTIDLSLGVNEIKIKNTSTLKTKKLLTKRNLRLKDSKINVCISGNRLESDLMIEKNIEIIKALSNDKEIDLHFIGFISKDFIENININASFHGYTTNFEHVTGAFDFMVNLFRLGNAHSALYSILSGTICLSPKKTDWDIYIDEQCFYTTKDELTKKIKLLSSNNILSKRIIKKQNENLKKAVFSPSVATKKIRETLNNHPCL